MDEHFLFGITAPRGAPTLADSEAFRRGGFRAVRFVLGQHHPQEVAAWREVGASSLLLSVEEEPCHPTLSEGAFLACLMESLPAFVAEGITALELPPWPDSVAGGLGSVWSDGAAYAERFLHLRAELRTRFPALAVGFPALAALTPVAPFPSAALSFLEDAAPAVQVADWVALRTFWRGWDELRSRDGVLRLLPLLFDRFSEQRCLLTVFGALDPGCEAEERGEQVAEFLRLMRQYDRVGGAFATPWRPTTTEERPLAWRTEEGDATPLWSAVMGAPPMPDRWRLRFVWPTEYRAYNQRFGEHQALYASCCGSVGGHNGVDLRVDYQNPERSPIRAALDGVVSRVGYDAEGYGHYLRTRSTGPDGESITLLYAHLSRIEVAEGERVEAGKVIGWAGSSGMSTGPHLHFGMRVAGVVLPQTRDYLNPRPYLEPPVRGLPRAQYARTYVLLPPQAGVSWARAVIAATWDEYRFTVGGSADDAGIGDLDVRRVIAINPVAWGDDLAAFFRRFYPGVSYVEVEAEDEASLQEALLNLPLAEPAPTPTIHPRGLPRTQYARTYVLLPPSAGAAWAEAVVEATWESRRFTVGGSADDAGIGDLDERRVIAINPAAWGGDLALFFRLHYPGVAYEALEVEGPAALREALAER